MSFGSRIRVFFENLQGSLSTPNERLLLGETGGDTFNVLTGSATGFLRPNTQYVLMYGFILQKKLAGATPPATASGFMHLAFVPEPTTALLLAIAGLGAATTPRVARRY